MNLGAASNASERRKSTQDLLTLLWQTPQKFRYNKTNSPKLLNLFSAPANTLLTYRSRGGGGGVGGAGGSGLRSGGGGGSGSGSIYAANGMTNVYTPTNLSSLITSIKDGDVKQLADELEMRDWNVNQSINGRYALHFAADYGQAEVLQFLIERGALVNVRDLDGVTPLLAAIYEGRTRCVELLLAHGADANGSTPDGKGYSDAADKDEIKQLLLHKTSNVATTTTASTLATKR